MTIQKKASDQYFPRILYEVVLTFESVNEFLKCDHSNVCDDVDRRFDNLSGSCHQSQVNRESSVDVISLWALF